MHSKKNQSTVDITNKRTVHFANFTYATKLFTSEKPIAQATTTNTTKTFILIILYVESPLTVLTRNG